MTLTIKLDQAGVYYPTEVESFAAAFFDPKRKQSALHQYLKPAADRFFHGLGDEAAERFRRDLGTFLRLYDFLSQIIPYNDSDLEKRYAFGKHLMPRIAQHITDNTVDLDSDVRLTHYRLQKLGQQTLDLASGEIVKLLPISEAGSGRGVEDEKRPLAAIVEKMNDLFSGDLSEADMVGYVMTIKGKLMEDETLAQQAAHNTEEQFRMGDFKDRLTDIILDGQESHNSIADQLLKDERIFAAMEGMLAKIIYRAFAEVRAE